MEVNYEMLALQFKKLLDKANIELANEMAKNENVLKLATEYKTMCADLQNKLDQANDTVNKYVLHYGEIKDEVDEEV